MRNLILLAGMSFLLLKVLPLRAQETSLSMPESPWQIRCSAGEGDPARECEMFQRLVVRNTGQRMAEFAVGFPKGKENARGVFILPLGILLQEPSVMEIDERQKVQFRIRYCIAEGCFAIVDLGPQLLDTLRRGNKAVIRSRIIAGEELAIPFSLDGFTAALKGITP